MAGFSSPAEGIAAAAGGRSSDFERLRLAGARKDSRVRTLCWIFFFKRLDDEVLVAKLGFLLEAAEDEDEEKEE